VNTPAHRAIVRLSWQAHTQPGAWRYALGFVVLLMAPTTGIALAMGQGTGAALAANGLLVLAALAWLACDGLWTQNTPTLARLLPGQVRAMQELLVLLVFVLAALAALLLHAWLGLGWRGFWAAMLVLLMVVAVQREPWLWILAWLGFSGVWALGPVRASRLHPCRCSLRPHSAARCCWPPASAAAGAGTTRRRRGVCAGKRAGRP
jgi:hypothetical protein